MHTGDAGYQALVSSDWNQCLAPCGPFDVISFSYPELTDDLRGIFQRYTGNAITLGQAVAQLEKRLPNPIRPEQMDAYLDRAFMTYPGVSDFITWCDAHKILFMINTTGMVGYFQRVFAKDLLPRVPVLSAHPMIRYEWPAGDPIRVFDLLEIEDKGRNTEHALRAFNIPARRLVLIGDSGGDGPHFEWGARHGAMLIGSMTKPSLATYCRGKGISIDYQFGVTYPEGLKRDPEAEMRTDFMQLSKIIQDRLGL